MGRSWLSENQALDHDFASEDELTTTSGILRDYTTTVSGYLQTQHDTHIDINTDDHLNYVPRDGSRGFTNTVSGVDPIEPHHLTTKGYIDTVSGTIDESILHEITVILSARGEIGSGGGWADDGSIEDLPVILFSPVVDQRMVLVYRAIDTMSLITDPYLAISTYSTLTPASGTQIRWELNVKYVYYGETPSKSADETLYVTQTLDDDPSYLASNTRNSDLVFTLDADLIETFDVIYARLTRLSTDILDTYGYDFAAGDAWLHYHISAYHGG